MKPLAIFHSIFFSVFHFLDPYYDFNFDDTARSKAC